ncbi:MAG: hypothetical protein ABIJ18_00400 [archaeon]
MKRGMIIIIILLSICFVSADNGCCAEKNGMYCVYTAEEECTGDFVANAVCDDVSFCDLGCCVTDDGICAQQTGKYTCEQNNGEWSDDASCSYSECDKGCCQFGNEYSFTTASHCSAVYADYEMEPSFDASVTDESECVMNNYLEDYGCCITEDSCGYVTGEECVAEGGDLEKDINTGYGFYGGQSCKSMGALLDTGDYEASCDCVSTDSLKCTTDHDVYETNTCGDVIIVDSCSYPNYACSEMSGSAECISTSCEDTFSFEENSETYFKDFNSYNVFYDDNGKLGVKEFTLGGRKDNFDTWCIYESPVGSFRDRVGSQQYRSYCIDGVEFIESCGEAREKYCAMYYDSDRDEFHGDCVDNNFEEFYGFEDVETEEGVDSERFYGSINYPVEDSEENLGVSTVSLAGNNYCESASITCEVVYGDSEYKNSEKYGWEPYLNTICLRPTFAATAAEYCSSRGDCGMELNVLGIEGQDSVESFNIDYDTSFIDGLWIVKDEKEMNFGIGPTCFDPNVIGKEPQLAVTLQGLDGFSSFKFMSEMMFMVTVAQPDPATFITTLIQTLIVLSEQEDNCQLIEKNTFEDDYYTGLKEIFVVNVNFLSDDMIPLWFPTEEMVYYSTYWLESCDSSDDKGNMLSYNLGTNLDTGDLDLDPVSQENTEQSVFFNSFISPLSGGISNLIILGADISKVQYNQLSGDPIEFDSTDPLTNLLSDALIEESSEVRNNFVISNEYGLINQFKSIKPWIMNKKALTPYSSNLGTLSSLEHPDALTQFVGYRAADCSTGDSEWIGLIDEDEHLLPASVIYQCGEWQAPTGGEYCELCDTPTEEGGIWFSKDGRPFYGAECNKYRCESLGSDCRYIEQNRGSDQPKCVSVDCEPGVQVVRTMYEEAIDESTANYPEMITKDEQQYGYTLTNVPPSTLFSFGVETDEFAACKFVSDEAVQQVFEANEVSNFEGLLAIGYTLEDLYDLMSGEGVTNTPSWGTECSPEDEDCSPGMTKQHNITANVMGSSEESIYYVWCKNPCGKINDAPYMIRLESSEIDPTYPPTIQSISPSDGGYARYDEDSVETYVYTDRPATCRYSNAPSDSYSIMQNEFSQCQDENLNIINGNYQCREFLDIGDDLNTFYFLCKDNYGNEMTQAKEWSITKSDPLLISQTSPSGTLYYNDVTLQVRTQQGAEQGKSICYFKENNQNNYVQMFESSDNELWLQELSDLSKGTYEYDIYCEDVAGNRNETTISFTVDVDSYAPQIENIYYLGSTLYVVTDEVTDCEYETSSFSFGNGFSMAGSASTDHSFTVTPGFNVYYAVCEDVYGNQNSPLIINLEYLQ